jgi:hypothetical protein
MYFWRLDIAIVILISSNDLIGNRILDLPVHRKTDVLEEITNTQPRKEMKHEAHV